MFSTPARSRFGPRLRGTVLLTALAMILSMFGLAGPATAAPSSAVPAGTASISGTVTDSAGKPIEGVSVTASTNGMGGWTQAVTAADGTYTAAGLAAGTYQVSFSDPAGNYVGTIYGGSSQTAIPVTVGVGASAVGIDASLVAAGSVTGTVTDSAGAPLADVQVWLTSASNLSSGYAMTLEDGTYTVRGVLAGTYRVQFSASPRNFVAAYYGGATLATAIPIAVVAGAVKSGIDAELADGGSISGRVLDSAGAPVESIAVTATGSSSTNAAGMSGPSASTAADGTYTINGLANDSYVVGFSGYGHNFLSAYYGGATADAATRVPVVAGAKADLDDVTLITGGSIAGTLTDSAGSPISGASVSVQGTGTGFGSVSNWTTTGADGTYRVQGLVTDSYKVSFTTSGLNFVDAYYGGATAVAVPVTVGVAVTKIDATLVTGGMISGTVTDSAGAPVSGISVSASGTSFSSSYKYATTSVDGTYTIRGLASGEYRVSFSTGSLDLVGEYFDGAGFGDATLVAVTAGTTAGSIDASLAVGAAISGTLTDAAGAPVAGVQISASSSAAGTGIGSSGFSASDGTYTVRGLAAGSYHLGFAVPDGVNLVSAYYGGSSSAQGTAIAVAAGERVGKIDATLEPGGTIEGTVTGPDGKPLAGSYVYDSTAGSWTGHAQSGIDGTYRMVGLAAGAHRLHFSSPAGVSLVGEYYDNAVSPSDATPVELAKAGAVTGIDAQLEVGASIAGTVTGPDGKPLAAITVSANSDLGGYGSAMTAGDGTYTIPGLPTGVYSVSFSAQPSTGLVGETYDNAAWDAATPVTATAGKTTPGINAQLLLGGSLSGTVTGPDGKPVGGLWVQFDDGAGGYVGDAQTAADGTYTATAVPAGSYTVSFLPTNEQNLLREFWKNATTAADATPVVVVLGALTSGIDASLVAGGMIAGAVTGPAPDGSICIDALPVGDLGQVAASVCANPDYALGGLPTGDYLVHFTGSDVLPQYFDGVNRPADATPVHVVQGTTVGSIDAALVAQGTTIPVVKVTMSPVAPKVGELVTIDVIVTGAGEPPTGTVSLSSTYENLGDVELVNGLGTTTTTFTEADPSEGIDAWYFGDSTYSGALGYVRFAVTDAPAAVATRTTLTASAATSVPGAPVTLTANVSSEAGSPAGEVTFRNGDVVLGTATLAGGQASFTTSALPLGSSALSATYGGSATYVASSGTTTHEVALPGAPTVTGLSRSFGATTGGTAVTLTGTGFTGATQVLFGDVTAAFTVVSSTTILAVAPAHVVGLAAVRIVAPTGTSLGAAGASFEYRNYTADSATQNYVRRVYTDLFSRDPDVGGLGTWTNLLTTGTQRVAVANAITYSTEFRTGLITGSYKTYLNGRAPDAQGMTDWLAAMGRGLTVSQMESGFIASDEFYGYEGSTDSGWVTGLYRTVLDRAASADEVSGWTSLLARHAATRQDVAMGFLLSSERLSTVVDGYYADYLGRHLDPSGQRTWVEMLQGGGRNEAIIGGIIASEEYFARR